VAHAGSTPGAKFGLLKFRFDVENSTRNLKWNLMNESSLQKSPRARFGNWLLPIVIAIGAAGAGVTGTLLWMENRAPAPTTSPPASTSGSTSYLELPTSATPSAPMANPTAPNAAAPNAAAPNAAAPNADSQHEPPASLTAGLTPAQKALTLGNWYFDHQAWPRAVNHYQRAIAQGLDNPDVRTDLGSALRFSGQPQKALEQYRIAQKQNPQHEHSLFNQGGVYAFDLKQTGKGIAVWREYLQRFPKGQNAAQTRELIARVQASSKSANSKTPSSQKPVAP
jgi:hypothetical protein